NSKFSSGTEDEPRRAIASAGRMRISVKLTTSSPRSGDLGSGWQPRYDQVEVRSGAFVERHQRARIAGARGRRPRELFRQGQGGVEKIAMEPPDVEFTFGQRDRVG